MAIVAEGVTKSFANIRVLDDVEVSVADGQIHALLGANGSGKSTFAKVLSGVYQPDRASIDIKGRTVPAILSPQHANELGVAIVHQEAPLIDTASVAECVALHRGYPHARASCIGGNFTATLKPCCCASMSASIRARLLAG